MSDRRSFLKYMLSGNTAAVVPTFGRDYHHELGIKKVINATGPYSSLGGAIMWPEVMEAMDYAVQNKAEMEDLHSAVGKRIAELIGAEAAMVAAGAASAISLATAGCMSGLNEEILHSLPHSKNIKNEVILQTSHQYLYDRALRVPGAKLVFVETEEELAAAISPKTAMMFYVRKTHGQINIHRWIELGKEYNIPTLCDAATTVPPIQNLLDTVALGFDLCCFSGGKGLRGPYSAGILLGRKDLIEAAKVNGSPNHRAVGRSMKVAPEEYLGMMVAVEVSLKHDEEKDMKQYLKLAQYMASEIGSLDGVTAEILTSEAHGMEPYINVDWDQNKYGINKEALKLALRNGDPGIEIRAMFLSLGELHLTGHMLKPEEEKIVVDRVKEILLENVRGEKQ